MSEFGFEFGDLWHAGDGLMHDLMHDLPALENSLLDSTANMAALSEKVKEVADHTKNPTRLLKLWSDIQVILAKKKKNSSDKPVAQSDPHEGLTPEDNIILRKKLRALQHEFHLFFAKANAKFAFINKAFILSPVFLGDVVFSDWVEYALPALRPVFFGFGVHLAYKASKESHADKTHHHLSYQEMLKKHAGRHAFAMLEIATVLTIFTAGMPRSRQELVLGMFSFTMIASDQLVLLIPRLELYGDRLAEEGRNPATRFLGRSFQRSGEFVINEVLPRAKKVGEFILAGRALTHSSLFVEQKLEEGWKYVEENFVLLPEYVKNIVSSGAVGFAMSIVAGLAHKHAVVPLHDRLSKTQLWRSFASASKVAVVNAFLMKRPEDLTNGHWAPFLLAARPDYNKRLGPPPQIPKPKFHAEYPNGLHIEGLTL